MILKKLNLKKLVNMKKNFKSFLFGLVSGMAVVAICFFLLVPRTVNNYKGKHKIKGDNNSMSYTVQQVQKMQKEWGKNCEESLKKAFKKKKEKIKKSR